MNRERAWSDMESHRPSTPPSPIEAATSISLNLPSRQHDLESLVRADDRTLSRRRVEGINYRLMYGGRSLWVLATGASGGGFAHCAVPDGGEETQLIEVIDIDDCSCRVRIHTRAGEYTACVNLPRRAGDVLRWRTTLLPSADVRVSGWPRDVLAISSGGRPTDTAGIVYAKQKSITGNVLFGSIAEQTSARGLTLLYAQNIGALTEYFEQTKQSAVEVVGGEWPELGFELPPAKEAPLMRGREYVVSDAYVALREVVPVDDVEKADLFLQMYAQLYLVFPKPEALHRDWPRRVHETVRDLSHSPECGEDIEGHRYMFAYAGTRDRPPESMVQLAVLVPLCEYAKARELSIPLAEAISQNLKTFYEERVKAVVRWLPRAHDRLKGQEEHMKPEVMDSWYSLHTCMNLGRMVQYRNADARSLFLNSAEFNIRVAQRFDYQWPVFYDQYTLEIIKAETRSGHGGEHDVGALYARVMLAAFELTNERRYLDEAEKASAKLAGLGFDLAYQYNNVAFGAGAFQRLFKITGKPRYRELALICWANVIRNLWLWDCNYGHAKHYFTFFGLAPLQDAPYLALYEELEVLAAIHEYLHAAEEEAPPALRVLLPEYCKYLIHRAWYHYPSELPVDVLSDKPPSGALHRYLSVPVEDLREGWELAGQVGQEVYGASAPFIIATRHCHQLPGEDFVLHCTYPAAVRWEERVDGGIAHLQLRGDPRLGATIRLVASNFAPLPSFTVTLEGKPSRSIEGELAPLGYVEYVVPGDARVKVTWDKRSLYIGSTPVPTARKPKASTRSSFRAGNRVRKPRTAKSKRAS